MGKIKIFLLFPIVMSVGCASPQYQQTYHDPSMPELDLIYIGDKEWVDSFKDIYKGESDKFFAVYGDITILEKSPTITPEER